MNATLLKNIIKSFKLKQSDVQLLLDVLAAHKSMEQKMEEIGAIKVKKKDKILCGLSALLFDETMATRYIDILSGNKDVLRAWEKATPSEWRSNIIALALMIQNDAVSAPPTGKLNIFMLLIPLLISTTLFTPQLMIETLLKIASAHDFSPEDILVSADAICATYRNDCIKAPGKSSIQ